MTGLTNESICIRTKRNLGLDIKANTPVINLSLVATAPTSAGLFQCVIYRDSVTVTSAVVQGPRRWLSRRMFLLCKKVDLCLSSRNYMKLGVIAYIWNPSAPKLRWETKAGEFPGSYWAS